MQFGLGYNFYENEHFKIGVFYKGYLAYMNTFLKMYKTYAPIVPNPKEEEDYALIIDSKEFGPIFSSENTLGLSINTKLFNNIYLSITGGVGITYLKNHSNDVVVGLEQRGGNFLSSSFSLGLGYIFKKKKEMVLPKKAHNSK